MTGANRPFLPGIFAILAGSAVFLAWAAPMSSGRAAGDETKGAVPGTPGDDVQDLIYFGPTRAIVIRLHLRIDGQPFSDFRTIAARRIFDMIDVDGNGVLEGKELAGIPAADLLEAAAGKRTGSTTSGTGSGAPGLQVGSSAAAKSTGGRAASATQSNRGPSGADRRSFTPDTLAAYVLPHLGSPFALAVNSVGMSAGKEQVPSVNGYQEAIRLDMASFLAVLDADGDGRVTMAECARVDNLFRMFDLNDDETISRTEIAEVAAAKNSAGMEPSASLSGVATRVLPIDRRGSRTQLVRKLLQCYGRTSPDRTTGRVARDGTLSAAELGISPDALANFDKNRDGRLDEREAADWLADPTPQFELDVALPKKSLQSPAVVVRHGTKAMDAEGVSMRQAADGVVVLQIGQVPIQLRAAESPPRPVSRTAYHKSLFKRADRDNNDYLDANELASTDQGLGPDEFKAIDRDHNGMIFENEWLAFMALHDILAEHRITLTLSTPATDPVTQFDSNGDGRLSRSELIRALATIKSWDVNHDGRISADEIPTRFEGTFHLGTLPKQASRRAMSEMRPPAAPPSTAPAWFQKMDRNRDGEVSLREFLGPLSVFRRLDANHDGYLDADEARSLKHE